MDIASSFRNTAAGLIAVFCMATPTFAASDYFLKIEGIDGESSIEAGAIDVDAFAIDIVSPRDAASGLATGKRRVEAPDSDSDSSDPATANRDPASGLPTGKRVHGKFMVSHLSVSKELDKSSPLIAQACALGQPIPKAELICRISGRDEPTYLRYELKNVLVTSYSPTGDKADDKPVEEISLGFSEITMAYTVKGEDGKPETIELNYDLSNKKKKTKK